MVKALWLAVILNLFLSTAHSQWVTVSQLPAVELGGYPSVSVPNCSTIVISGGDNNNPRVYISTNSGINFSNITGNISVNELYCLYALNKDTIFTGDGGSAGGLGGNARVYKTINGGLNWTTILTTGGNSGFISGITFSKLNPNFGIIVSDPAISNDSFWIAKTYDRGATWQITKAPNGVAPYTTQNSVFAVDSLFYGFGLISSPAKFYLTTNGGISWALKLLGLSGNSVPSIAFKNDKLNGIALSDVTLPNLARTTNSGQNWQIVNSGAGTTGTGTVKWIHGTDIFYLAASNIKRTSDNGQSWYLMTMESVPAISQMDIYSAGFNSICAYALAANGKLLKYEGEPFAINIYNSTVPTEFLLEQNYPNPFNPVTTINYSVPEPSEIKISISDLTGKEIIQVISGFHNTGNYTESIDLTALSSGVYIYTLKSEKVSISKKMALIK